MPQEAWVLKCCLCVKFQVQLKKKAKTWQCRVCGKKQDIMNIYYKGEPSDCRINVQRLNTAEGEKLEQLQEDSYVTDESFNNPEPDYDQEQDQEYNLECDEESDDILSESRLECGSDYISDNEVEELLEKAALDLSKERFEIEGAISQQDLEPKKFLTKPREKIIEESKIIKNKDDPYDVNTIDFTIKVEKRSLPLHSIQHLSIFESNSEIDETLDF